MKLVACDHGGFRLKNVLMKDLKKQGYEVVDFGTYNEESCDYPDYAARLPELSQVGNVKKVLLFVERVLVFLLHVIKLMVFVVRWFMMCLVLKQQEHTMIQI